MDQLTKIKQKLDMVKGESPSKIESELIEVCEMLLEEIRRLKGDHG